MLSRKFPRNQATPQDVSYIPVLLLYHYCYWNRILIVVIGCDISDLGRISCVDIVTGNASLSYICSIVLICHYIDFFLVLSLEPMQGSQIVVLPSLSFHCLWCPYLFKAKRSQLGFPYSPALVFSLKISKPNCSSSDWEASKVTDDVFQLLSLYLSLSLSLLWLSHRLPILSCHAIHIKTISRFTSTGPALQLDYDNQSVFMFCGRSPPE